MDKDELWTFLLGVGAGIAIGVLLAPKSGADTRRLIKDKTGEGADHLKQSATDLRNSAADLLDKGKEAVDRQKDIIEEAMRAGQQAYRDTINPPPPSSTESAHR